MGGRLSPEMDKQHTRSVIQIREMILRGELVPGQRVSEAGLAEMLGISRTPIRQALPVLAQEGLLTAHDTRGYVVRGFTQAEIHDAVELRGMLEGFAVRRLIERGPSKKLLRSLHDALEEGDRLLQKRSVLSTDEALYAEINRQFHGAIVEECGSSLVSAALDRNARIPFTAPQAVAFRSANLEEVYDLLFYAHRQHHDIVRAIEAGQAARGEALMREHAHRVKESLNFGASAEATQGGPVRLFR